MPRARYHARWASGPAALVCLHLALGGCASDSLAAGSSPGDPPDAGAVTEAGPACSCGPLFPVCSDGQVLAILAAELSARVDVANAVRASLASANALDLAEKIITDDSVLRVQVQGEMRETGIAAAPGGVDRQIATEAQWTIQALATKNPPDLDAAYVDGEVLAHLRALGLIDQLLGPSTHDRRIADLLARVRPLVVQHAQAASQAQSELEGACAGRPG
jgi:predicted outer membrane protein